MFYNLGNAWGYNPVPVGSLADTLGTINPLRYRSYVYDTETGYYYLQSRYYDPEIGRFINADALVTTGQGLLGNNMFAYCLNNPVNGSDPCGNCMHYWYLLGLKDCDACREKTFGEKWQDYCENGLTATFTSGLFLTFTLGPFNISGSVELAYDLKGNVQLVATASFDIGPSDCFSLSGGTSHSAFIMPDTSYLAGDTYYMGGGVCAPIPETPIAVSAGGNIGQTSDGYWGIMTTTGFAHANSIGWDLHAGYAKTTTITEQYNIIDVVVGLFS